jgi:hypothetical protein
MQWEVRKDGEVLAIKDNMSDCVRAAQRLYNDEKREQAA